MTSILEVIVGGLQSHFPSVYWGYVRAEGQSYSSLYLTRLKNGDEISLQISDNIVLITLLQLIDNPFVSCDVRETKRQVDILSDDFLEQIICSLREFGVNCE